MPHILLHPERIIVVIFLIFTFIIAILATKKIKNIRYYALRNKTFTTVRLTASVLASCWGGGGLLLNIEEIHHQGFYWLMVLFSIVPSMWLISRLAVRMSSFMHHASIPETIGYAYGNIPRIIAGVSCLLSLIGLIAIQLIVMSKAFSCISNIDPIMATFVALVIVWIYTTFSDIHAATYTDVVQVLIFSTILPWLAWCVFSKIDNPENIIPLLQSQEKWKNILQIDKNFFGLLVLMITFILADIDPQCLSKIYMASNILQARRVFSYATWLALVVAFFVGLIGISISVKAPHIQPYEIFDYLTMHIPHGLLRGVWCIGLLAMCISTAEACLNASVVIFHQDVMNNLVQPNKPYSALWARLIVLCIGLLALLLVHFQNNLFILLQMTLALRMPIVTTPLLFAIFGFRTTSRAALWGMITGGLTILIWNKWVTAEMRIYGVLPAMLVNGLSILGSHYLVAKTKGKGWIEPDDQIKQLQQQEKLRIVRIIQRLKNLNLKDALFSLVPSFNTLTLVSTYIIATSMISIFSTPTVPQFSWYGLRIAGGAFFLVYPLFYEDKKLPWWTGLLWIIVCFLVALNTTWRALHATSIQFTIASLFFHFVILLLCMPLLLAFVIYFLAFFICFGKPKFLMNSFLKEEVLAIHPYFEHIQEIGLGLLLVAILLSYKKQIIALSQQLKHRTLAKQAIDQETNEQLLYRQQVDLYTTATNKEWVLLDGFVKRIYNRITKHPGPEASEWIIQDLQGLAAFLEDRVYYSQAHLVLKTTKISIDNLLEQIEASLFGEFQYHPRVLIDKGPNLPEYLICDVEKIVRMLTMLIGQFIHNQPDPDGLIKILLRQTHLRFLMIYDGTKNLAPSILSPSLAICLTDSTQTSPVIQAVYQDKRENILNKIYALEQKMSLNEREIQRIIYAHFGYIATKKETVSTIKAPCMETTTTIVLPINIRSIREEVMDKLVTYPENLETFSSNEAYWQDHPEGSKIMAKLLAVIASKKVLNNLNIKETIALLSRCYGREQDNLGTPLFIRAMGITYLLITRMTLYPEAVQAALTYDLVRYTAVPISYIRAIYGPVVFFLVQHLLQTNQYHSTRKRKISLQEHYEKLVGYGNIYVIYIKIAESLFDLTHVNISTDQKALQELITKVETIALPLVTEIKNKILEELTPTLAKDLARARSYLATSI